ncbi:N-acetylglucosamine-6-phosphate deacetylase [Rhodobacteraceae bacterium RKSG542]|uniref:N-acetylglucosamine-6-phosphate deacetylase n=1 Tax=Pseudovibrio flavus TaxID=2529854 RepID=UPI0012BC59E4|nr:N-acetylglucosamine-6-phosphate deacetylase [Pseudovibrio flavus]MTI18084.1 N-acetylglucosamine-6-phosphate deacetylase [Pseudovibrio flavus]
MPETNQPRFVFARRLFDGSGAEPKSNQLITIDAGRIEAIDGADEKQARENGAVVADIAAPGFIDIQINGANDVQFDSKCGASGLLKIAEGARKGGTAHLLPTFITASGTAYEGALAGVQEAMAMATSSGIIGIHLEGPFLSKQRPGIHSAGFIRELDESDLERLRATFPGKLLLTLAPECTSSTVLEQLEKAGVIVFVGHSQASGDECSKALEHGLKGATHLFNAMSQISARDPGVVGSILAHEEAFAGIIADGVHVHPDNLKLAATLKPDTLCLVSDAMQTLAGTKTEFELDGYRIFLRDGRLTNAEGTLAGAQLAMNEAVANMVRYAEVDLAAALKMAGTNPAHALGLASELGYLRSGYRASITLLDNDLSVSQVLVDGHS